jgi:hypothetical protein
VSSGEPNPNRRCVTEQEFAQAHLATLAVKLHKPLSSCRLPVVDKKAGDRTEFDNPFLVNSIAAALAVGFS